MQKSDRDEIEKLQDTLSVLMESHRMDMIGDHAKKILALDPENEFAYYALIYSLINRQMDDELLDTCQTALKLFPNEAWVHSRIYYYYIHKGGDEYVKAKKHAETAIKLDPNESIYYRDLAEVYLINREPEKALVHLDKAVHLAPSNAEYRSRRALALVRVGRVNEALEAVDKALHDDPDHKDVLDTAGMVYLLSGEVEKAEELFRDALRRYPTYNYFQSHLEWVEREKKDKEMRLQQGKTYTPLYKRQTDRKRFFDEDKL